MEKINLGNSKNGCKSDRAQTYSFFSVSHRYVCVVYVHVFALAHVCMCVRAHVLVQMYVYGGTEVNPESSLALYLI